MQKKLKKALNGFHDIDAIVMLSLSEKILMTPSALQKNIKVLWLEHDKIGRWLRKNPSLPTLKELSHKVTTVVVSDLSKKIYMDLGWPDERVVAIPNGIDTQRFAGWAAVEHKKLTAGCVSRLSPEKGVDVLVAAANDMEDMEVIINGEGPEHSAISAAIRSENIRMQGRRRDIADFYAIIDMLILPSREHDPFGLVAAEAMLLGIPVIVTDACGIAGYLTNKKDALIVKADSAKELREGMEIMKDPDRRKAIGMAGKDTAERLFPLEKMIERYQQLLSA